jgi:hypothetical protein
VAGLEPLLDARARDEYRERLAELRAEVDAAEQRNDAIAADRARHELDALETALTEAFGLGGRERRLGDPAERARKAVYNRVRGAISALEAQHAELGRHLAHSIRTGTYCSYRPERSVQWRVIQPQSPLRRPQR